MATKKNGCGFLIIALVLLILGGVIAAFLGWSAFSTGEEFVENIEDSEVFVTPETLNYTSTIDGEVTVWLTSDTAQAIGEIKIEVTDTESGESSVAVTPTTTSQMGDQHFVAAFSVTKGKSYTVKAKGVEDGKTLRVAAIDSNAVLAIIGKSFAALAAFGVFALLALVFGIIGLVKYFGSNNQTPAPPAG